MSKFSACYDEKAGTVTVYCLNCSQILVENKHPVKLVNRIELPATNRFKQNLLNLTYYFKQKKGKNPDDYDIKVIDYQDWIKKTGSDKPKDGFQKFKQQFGSIPLSLKRDILNDLIRETSVNIGPFMLCANRLCNLIQFYESHKYSTSLSEVKARIKGVTLMRSSSPSVRDHCILSIDLLPSSTNRTVGCFLHFTGYRYPTWKKGRYDALRFVTEILQLNLDDSNVKDHKDWLPYPKTHPPKKRKTMAEYLRMIDEYRSTNCTKETPTPQEPQPQVMEVMERMEPNLEDVEVRWFVYRYDSNSEKYFSYGRFERKERASWLLTLLRKKYHTNDGHHTGLTEEPQTTYFRAVHDREWKDIDTEFSWFPVLWHCHYSFPPGMHFSDSPFALKLKKKWLEPCGRYATLRFQRKNNLIVVLNLCEDCALTKRLHDPDFEKDWICDRGDALWVPDEKDELRVPSRWSKNPTWRLARSDDCETKKKDEILLKSMFPKEFKPFAEMKIKVI